MTELPLQQMVGGQIRHLLWIGTQLRELSERTPFFHLFVAQAERDRRHIRLNNGLRNPFIRNSRDDARAAPLLHLRDFVHVVARRDVKTPGTVQPGIPRNATQ